MTADAVFAAWPTEATIASIHAGMHSKLSEEISMTCEQAVPIDPPWPSTDEVDEYLRHVEGCVDVYRAARFPAIKPNEALREDVKPGTEAPHYSAC